MRVSSVNTGAYNCIAEAARLVAAEAMNSVYYTLARFSSSSPALSKPLVWREVYDLEKMSPGTW